MLPVCMTIFLSAFLSVFNSVKIERPSLNAKLTTDGWLKIAGLRLAAIAIYLFYAMHCILCIHYMHYILCILLHALYSKHSILCILSHELYTIHVHVLCFSFYAFCSVHSNPYIFFQSYWCYMHIILEISFIHLTFCFFSH